MSDTTATNFSIKKSIPALVSFFVFSIGFSPLALFLYLFIRYAPLHQWWFYVLIPFLLYIVLALEIVFLVLISGAFIHVFRLTYTPGIYPYEYTESNALKWMIVCGLYTPIRKLIATVLIGSLKNVYLRLIGMKIGSNCLVGGVIKDPCVTEFGDNVTMGEYAIIYGHITNYKQETISIEPVCIGNNCVIGAGAIIMPGVTMQDSAIVAAGALVPKNMVLEANSCYAGVPAKKLPR